jgi:branched-subunit amino acid aminotransferase/4-amino-4-deoxychorismate lyase
MNAVSNIFLYGKGVFTTVAIRSQMPLLWEKHFLRLRRDLCAIGLNETEISQESLFDKLTKELEANSIFSGRARITVSDETQSRIWCGDPAEQISVQLIVAEARPVPPDLSVGISPYPVNSLSPLAGVKSCNYLEQLMSKTEAEGRGFEEAIRLNERGDVTSGCMSNVFWLRNGEMFTPSLKTGCLPGTTREYVIENLDCYEVEVGIEELRRADTIFLTSAGLGIVEVAGFEDNRLLRSRHPITSLWPPT